MAKEDIPPLGKVPKKRRQLERALDVHVAMWLALPDGELTPSEKRRVADEKARRRERTVPVVVGFSGSRAGITPAQKRQIEAWLDEWEPVEAHHGDCVGGDETFHSMSRARHIPVVVHPPIDNGLRAFCDGAERAEKAKDFQVRNKDIVQAVSRLVAAPKEGREPPPARGQGTWATVRFARHRSTDIHVVMPTGHIL